MIVIVDYGMGNVASVANMIRRVGGEAKLSSSPDEIRLAHKLILPGVGSFDPGVKALRERSLDVALREAVSTGGAQLLGICLGMQLLFDASEEGSLPGLGLVRGRVRRFQVKEHGLRVPHMGWNVAHPASHSRLFDPAEREPRFYFVHSYHAECDDALDVSATAHYGYDFACTVERSNVMGVQFHPEKSHRFGMALLQRFTAL
jgi:glutamine amidotransferase